MFYDTFESLCKKKGVSCARAAREMGLSNSITSYWKQSGRAPAGENLQKVASYFDVSASELLDEQKEKPGISAEQSEVLALLDKMKPENRAEAIRYLRYILDTQEK